MSTLSRILPAIEWSKNYSSATLRSDTSAGLTTAVMLIPQGMAYALLADLPPIMGLYAATVPLLAYAVLGSSRQLAVGPMALASLLVAGGVNELLPPDQVTIENTAALAILLTVLAGAFQLVLAALRLGGLVNLLSHPVVSGFTGAAAILIGASQLQHLVGIDLPRGLGVLGTLDHIVRHIQEANGVSVGIGVAAILLIWGLKRFKPQAPAALFAVVLGIVASWAFDFGSLGVRILGEIPAGMPSPSVPTYTWEQVKTAAPLGLTIALVGFMESISAAKTYARANRYEISAGSELVGLGVANLTAALFGGYTVGGALSRTAVNASAGAKTPLANVVTAAAVVFTLAFLTPVFFFLPKPVLAAIILVAVAGLIDVAEAIHLWKVKRDDLAILVITFLATLFYTIELGILVGVGASLLWLVYTTTRPHTVILGRIPDTRSYRCITHHENAQTFRRIVIMRMDAQYFFGNVAYLKDTLLKNVDDTPDCVAVVLDASSINSLDSTAADTYEELVMEMRRSNVEMFISHVKETVLVVMRTTGLVDRLGEGHVFYEVEDAVDAAVRHRDAVEAGVPREEEDFGKSDFVD
jgi:sulfate permease, SulP family